MNPTKVIDSMYCQFYAARSMSYTGVYYCYSSVIFVITYCKNTLQINELNPEFESFIPDKHLEQKSKYKHHDQFDRAGIVDVEASCTYTGTSECLTHCK